VAKKAEEAKKLMLKQLGKRQIWQLKFEHKYLTFNDLNTNPIAHFNFKFLCNPLKSCENILITRPYIYKPRFFPKSPEAFYTFG